MKSNCRGSDTWAGLHVSLDYAGVFVVSTFRTEGWCVLFLHGDVVRNHGKLISYCRTVLTKPTLSVEVLEYIFVPMLHLYDLETIPCLNAVIKSTRRTVV